MKITKSALNIIRKKELNLHWFCMTCDLQVVTTPNLIHKVNEDNKLLRNSLILVEERL